MNPPTAHHAPDAAPQAAQPPRRSSAHWLGVAGALLLLAVPAYAAWAQAPFVITLMSRIVVFAIAAVSLNLLVGYGGLVSLGHALFLGLGVYATAILGHYGIHGGWAHLGATLAACALVGLVTGSVALRTRGMAFIMITLAFAQMFFFLFVSLRQFGGDDGMRWQGGSQFGGWTLFDGMTLYWAALAVLAASVYTMHRLIHARFGVVVRAARDNERRMRALGYPVFRYQLTAYVLSACLCGVAGMLYANLTQFASPSYMAWIMSGELIVMVVLGGMGTLLGPVFGALAMILTEEGLKWLTPHWMVVFGPLIVLVVLTSRRGIAGWLAAWDARRAERRP